ncbi:MAG: hypothetical protein WA003_06680 [Desulfuromonadaceae bacterium]
MNLKETGEYQMTVFNSRYYSLAAGQPTDTAAYSDDLRSALDAITPNLRRTFLVGEVSAITSHVTDGIRDIVRKDKRVRDLVLNKGALPLATWAEMLDFVSENSVEQLKAILSDMQYQLEHGKIQGFPGTMFIYHKPTFVTLEPFYSLLFSLMAEMGG